VAALFITTVFHLSIHVWNGYDGLLEPLRDTGQCKVYLTSARSWCKLAPMKNDMRRLRTERGLTQQQLGEAMGVSRQTINAIEVDRYTPSLPLAIALARFFKLTVEELFCDEPESPNVE
jgi:putative transcriptional regulator